ncbi:unnamed protein product [Brassica rapa subsp. trilocularis]
MLLLRLERGDESDDGGIVTSPRFTRGGFSTRIKGLGKTEKCKLQKHLGEVSPKNFARMNRLLG